VQYKPYTFIYGLKDCVQTDHSGPPNLMSNVYRGLTVRVKQPERENYYHLGFRLGSSHGMAMFIVDDKGMGKIKDKLVPVLFLT